jgi:hypothetical protein
MYILYRTKNKLRRLRLILIARYRRSNKEVADWDFWGFDHYLAEIILSGVKRFRNDAIGFPPQYSNPEEYNKDLDIIIEGFTLYVGQESYDLTEEGLEKWNKAKKLFFELYETFWD